MTLRRSLPVLAPIALWLVACSAATVNSSSKALDPDWQNDSGASIAQVEQRLRALPLVANARVAVGVSDTGLVGATLDGKSRWTHAAQPTSAPIIAGPFVIYSEGARVVAL